MDKDKKAEERPSGSLAEDIFDSGYTFLRPWGEYKNHHTIPGVYHLKTLHLAPGAVLSLQRHQKRSETWILVSGEAEAVHGDSIDSLERTTLVNDEPFRVPVGSIHRLISENGAVIVEIMYGTYDEDDTERFEDIYGRIG